MRLFSSLVLLILFGCSNVTTPQSDKDNKTILETGKMIDEIAKERQATAVNNNSNLKFRYKACIENKVIKKPGLTNLSIDGIEISVKGQKIVEIGKTHLKQDVLNAITERFAIIDDLLSSNCMDLEREYASTNPDKEIKVKLLDQRERLIVTLANIANEIKAVQEKKKTPEELKKDVTSPDQKPTES